MRTIPLSEFRASLSSILQSVARIRRPIRVTRLGQFLVEVHPIPVGAAEEQRLRAEREARDLELLNRFADEMNKDAVDGLEDQADLFAETAPRKAKRTSRTRQP